MTRLQKKKIATATAATEKTHNINKILQNWAVLNAVSSVPPTRVTYIQIHIHTEWCIHLTKKISIKIYRYVSKWRTKKK